MADHSDSRPTGVRKTGLSRLTATRRSRALIVAITIVVLEALVFRSYFTGQNIPPWDFLGGYNTEAFLWWTEGGFFHPLNWVSNTWAGYPAALSLQNSAWYLPVGIASFFSPFTLHSAAILAALHVGLGSIGTYLLVRSFKLSFPIALMATVAGFFAVGYYSNAEHVDFNRGYALLPWLLLILSPAWPWKKWWSIPVASLVLWQILTGVYPGMLTSMVYAGGAWFITFQIIARSRLREFVIPVAISFGTALLLSAPRLLPYLLLSGDAASGLKEDSVFSLSMLGTLLYGYSSPGLPNDISMRSFFIPATILALAFFSTWKHRITKLAVSILVPAIVLGMPFCPWFQLIQNLPGLDLSRYTMSDFKMFLVLGIVMLACSGLALLIQLVKQEQYPKTLWWRVGALVTFGGAMGLTGLLGPYTKFDWVPGFLILLASGITVLAFVLLRSKRFSVTLFSSIMVALTATSGLVWVYTTTEPWLKNRVVGEMETFGDSVDNLIARRVEPTDAAQRAPRMLMGEKFTSESLYSGRWNRVYYLGIDAVGGYVNFKGSETQRRLVMTLTDPTLGPSFANFLAAPGSVLTTKMGHKLSPDDFASCANSQTNCGLAKVVPVRYFPGNFNYHIDSPQAVTGYLNESYFDGWSAQACTQGSNCVPVSAVRSEFGVIEVTLPGGSYTLKLTYTTAGRTVGWILFGIGAFSVAISTLLPRLGRIKLKKRVPT